MKDDPELLNILGGICIF